MNVVMEAKMVIAEHGPQSPDFLVGRLKAAIERCDEPETGRLDRLLQAVDQIQGHRHGNPTLANLLNLAFKR